MLTKQIQQANTASKCSEEQINGFLLQAAAGKPIKAIRRKQGFSDASFYKWCSKHGSTFRPTDALASHRVGWQRVLSFSVN